MLVVALSLFMVIGIDAEPAKVEAKPKPHLPSLTAEQIQSDSDLLLSVLRDVHPGYTRYRSAEDTAAAETAFQKAAGQARHVGDYYLAVSKFLATIRCEHTEAELPRDLSQWREGQPTMLPLHFRWVDGTALVLDVAPGVDGVAKGDALMAVDGRSMQSLFEAMAPHIAVDGFTDHTKATLFGGRDDIGFTTFDVFYPLFHGFSEFFELTVRSVDGTTRKASVPAVDEKTALSVRGLGKRYQNFSDEGAVSWRKEGNAAVLNVNTFVNYRTPVDPDEVFGPVFREIQASGVERLVYDLRNVGGGSTDVMHSLLSHLIAKPITLGGPSWVKTYDFSDHREHLSTWDKSVFSMPAELFTAEDLESKYGGLYRVSPKINGGAKTLEPAPDAWKGPLYVLIGPNNESGATLLLAELRDERQVTFVGQETGGSAEGPTAGILVFLMLPESKINVRVPLIWNTSSYADFIPGKGLKPDLEVPETLDDLRTGRDVALEVALGKRWL